jgi:hypothetical protein
MRRSLQQKPYLLPRNALDRICTLELNSTPAVRAETPGPFAGEEQPADPIVWHSKFNHNVLTSLRPQYRHRMLAVQGLTMATLSLL